jgi:hypothetical protein
VGFLERDFERDHLAEKSNRTKMGQKIHCEPVYFLAALVVKSIAAIGGEKSSKRE